MKPAWIIVGLSLSAIGCGDSGPEDLAKQDSQGNSRINDPQKSNLQSNESPTNDSRRTSLANAAKQASPEKVLPLADWRTVTSLDGVVSCEVAGVRQFRGITSQNSKLSFVDAARGDFQVRGSYYGRDMTESTLERLYDYEGVPEHKVLSRKNIALDGHPGLEIVVENTFKTPDSTFIVYEHIRSYFLNQWNYEFKWKGVAKNRENASRVFASIRILKMPEPPKHGQLTQEMKESLFRAWWREESYQARETDRKRIESNRQRTVESLSREFFVNESRVKDIIREGDAARWSKE